MKKLKCPILLLTLFMILPISKVYSQFDDNYWTALFKTNRPSPDKELRIGLSTLQLLNYPKPFFGFNMEYRIVIEKEELFGKEYQAYFYFRGALYFKQVRCSEGSFTALPADTLIPNPIIVPFKLIHTISCFSFDLGTNYDLYSNSKEIFTFYSGWVVGLNFFKYENRYKVSDYNKNDYVLQTDAEWKEYQKSGNVWFKGGVTLGIDIKIRKIYSIYLEALPSINLFTEKNYPLDIGAINLADHLSVGITLGYRMNIRPRFRYKF